MPRGRHQHSTRAVLLAVIAAGSGPANANAPPMPEDFLVYLGSWEADDADWMVANAANPQPTAAAAARSTAPDGATRPVSPSTTAARGTNTTTAAPGTERKP